MKLNVVGGLIEFFLVNRVICEGLLENKSFCKLITNLGSHQRKSEKDFCKSSKNNLKQHLTCQSIAKRKLSISPKVPIKFTCAPSCLPFAPLKTLQGAIGSSNKFI
jgi:hypothetical protein